jgi:hypothetical protein
MPYCPKCGKENKDDAVFCQSCGTSLKTEQVVYRRHEGSREKNEKQEKGERDEKGEKNEKNEGGGMTAGLVGGFIIIWLGLVFLLREYNYIASNDFGGWFMLGIGVILILRGVLAYIQTSNWRSSNGYIIGGLIVGAIGGFSVFELRDKWPYIVIIIGAYIVLSAFMTRTNNPKP